MRIYYERVEDGLHAAALHDAAYAFLRRVLREECGLCDPDIQKTAAGKPYIANSPVKISLSHTKGLVCCAVGESGELGIDCEYIRNVPERLSERVCTPKEAEGIRVSPDPAMRLLQLWTLKESISKKRGVGLRESFRQYEIRFEGDRPACDGHVLHLEHIDGFIIAAAE